MFSDLTTSCKKIHVSLEQQFQSSHIKKTDQQIRIYQYLHLFCNVSMVTSSFRNKVMRKTLCSLSSCFLASSQTPHRVWESSLETLWYSSFSHCLQVLKVNRITLSKKIFDKMTTRQLLVHTVLPPIRLNIMAEFHGTIGTVSYTHLIILQNLWDIHYVHSTIVYSKYPSLVYDGYWENTQFSYLQCYICT